MIKILSSTFSSSAARVAVNVLAVLVLVVQGYLFYQWEAYTECVGDRASLAAQRARAISRATDVERAAERELLRRPSPEARAAVFAAREHTDSVRSANPPAPGPETC